MKMFNDEGIKNAKENVRNLIAKLARTTPSDELTLRDIESIIFYLSDYKDELRSMEYDKKRKEHERIRKERSNHND